MYSGHDGPPPLVDAPGGFIPPPPGATHGGQPSGGGGWPQDGAGGYTPYSAPPLERPPQWYIDQQMQMQGRYPAFGPPHGPSTPYQPFSPHSPWSAPTPGATHSYGAATPGGSFGGPQTPAGPDPWGIDAAQRAAGLAPPDPFDAPPLRHTNSLPTHHGHGHDQAIGAGWFNGGGHRPSTPHTPHTPRRVTMKRPKSRPNTPFAGAFADEEDGFVGGFGGFNGGTPLHRAQSAGATLGYAVREDGPLHPFGGQATQQPYAADNLARRPRDWRADFDPPRKGLKGYIPRRHKSNVTEWSDPGKRQLTPLLEYKLDKPNIFYDVRFSVYQSDRPVIYFPNLQRTANLIDLHQLATNPPCEGMRIFHHLLPWYIDVIPSNPNGITLEDVIWQIHNQLMMQVAARDFFTEALTNDDRMQIATTFDRRFVLSNDPQEERQKGIRRVDYLNGYCIFEGLVRSKGMWEMKTRHLKEYKQFNQGNGMRVLYDGV